MAESRTKIVALLIVIFLLGAATGGLSYRLLTEKGYFRRPPHPSSRDRRGETVQKFTRELGLNPEQRQKLNNIFDELENKYAELNKSYRPQAETIRQESRNKIRAMLTDTQKPKFEEMLKQLDEHRRQREQSK